LWRDLTNRATTFISGKCLSQPANITATFYKYEQTSNGSNFSAAMATFRSKAAPAHPEK
jgi:hypothetical protein